MKHETVAILCCVGMVLTALVIDFEEANARWCETYPDMCVPVDKTEIAKSSEGSC